MSSIGTGYDLAASTFSPDGRIFQIEYAGKAVDNGGTAIGLRCKDGVVVCVEKPIGAVLELQSSKQRIFNVCSTIGACATGMYSDARQLIAYAREQAGDHAFAFREAISIDKLMMDTSTEAFRHTLSVSRPYGCAVLFCTWTQETGGRLFVLEPSAIYYEYLGWSIGKHRQGAKAELEKLSTEMTCADAIKELARIMLAVRDDAKDEKFKLEMGIVGQTTDGKFIRVTEATVTAAEEAALRSLEEEDSDNEEMQH